jgi:hypothetical protein
LPTPASPAASTTPRSPETKRRAAALVSATSRLKRSPSGSDVERPMFAPRPSRTNPSVDEGDANGRRAAQPPKRCASPRPGVPGRANLMP